MDCRSFPPTSPSGLDDLARAAEALSLAIVPAPGMLAPTNVSRQTQLELSRPGPSSASPRLTALSIV